MSIDYSQPGFYRFNTDSLELVKHVIKSDFKPRSILDLGAGSGIIGIELARELLPEKITFLELQSEYLEHLENNCRIFLPKGIKAEIQISSFGEFTHAEKFDLIVCNPPYYLPGKGELPLDPRRALARTFLKDSWDILIQLIAKSLDREGRAFIVLKNDERLRFEIEKKSAALKLAMKYQCSSDLIIIELFALNEN